MTRQLEAQKEQRQSKWDKQVVAACDGGLEDSIGRAGGVLSGFSFRTSEVECLMTLRVELAGRKQIAFVGGATLGNCLRKVKYLADRDELVWKEDRWAPSENGQK